MIYLDENGVTVKAKSGAKGAQAGEIYELNGKKYYVAIDQYDLQKIVKNKSYQNIPLNRIVTSKITTMNGLFYQWGNDFKAFNMVSILIFKFNAIINATNAFSAL